MSPGPDIDPFEPRWVRPPYSSTTATIPACRLASSLSALRFSPPLPMARPFLSGHHRSRHHRGPRRLHREFPSQAFHHYRTTPTCLLEPRSRSRVPQQKPYCP